MQNFIGDIAKINKEDRFKAITKVLDDNGIVYTVQHLNYYKALGNIIVEYNPRKGNKIVIGAHYDNVPGTPGANDNAASCSIVLNMILSLKNTDKHIQFVFFDLEERGCMGSKEFVYYDNTPVSYFINLDMCGMGENIVYTFKPFMFHDVLKEVVTKHHAIQVSSLPQSDSRTFIEINIPTLMVINSTAQDLTWYQNLPWGYDKFKETDFGQTMHTPNDTIDTININQVEKIYNFLMDVVEVF